VILGLAMVDQDIGSGKVQEAMDKRLKLLPGSEWQVRERRGRKKQINKSLPSKHFTARRALGSIEKGVRGDLSEVVSRITSKQEHSKTKE
jgi:hypothetical protein